MTLLLLLVLLVLLLLLLLLLVLLLLLPLLLLLLHERTCLVEDFPVVVARLTPQAFAERHWEAPACNEETLHR
jgi:hypothetical protein